MTPPVGSPQYENLSTEERGKYITDVLLQEVIAQMIISSEDLLQLAKEALPQGADEDAIDEKAHELARIELARGSCLKSVQASRQVRQLAGDGYVPDVKKEEEGEIGWTGRRRRPAR